MAALSALQSPMRIEEKMALLGSGGQCGEDRRETGGAEETEVSGQEQSIPKKRPNRAERNESMQRAVVEACFR